MLHLFLLSRWKPTILITLTLWASFQWNPLWETIMWCCLFIAVMYTQKQWKTGPPPCLSLQMRQRSTTTDVRIKHPDSSASIMKPLCCCRYLSSWYCQSCYRICSTKQEENKHRRKHNSFIEKSFHIWPPFTWFSLPAALLGLFSSANWYYIQSSAPLSHQPLHICIWGLPQCHIRFLCTSHRSSPYTCCCLWISCPTYYMGCTWCRWLLSWHSPRPL